MKLLFQGDSVTDAWRTDPGFYGINPTNLGLGYPPQVAKILRDNAIDAEVINRGVSGNRVVDMAKRWNEDCIALKPDYLTVLIGINDCWRKYDSNDETPVEKFYSGYEDLLNQVKEKTTAKIILMEPFVLPFPADRKEWRVTLDPMIAAVRELADKFADGFIPLDGIMNKASIERSPDIITMDGVHPTFEGHNIIANAWYNEFIKLI